MTGPRTEPVDPSSDRAPAATAASDAASPGAFWRDWGPPQGVRASARAAETVAPSGAPRGARRGEAQADMDPAQRAARARAAIRALAAAVAEDQGGERAARSAGTRWRTALRDAGRGSASQDLRHKPRRNQLRAGSDATGRIGAPDRRVSSVDRDARALARRGAVAAERLRRAVGARVRRARATAEWARVTAIAVSRAWPRRSRAFCERALSDARPRVAAAGRAARDAFTPSPRARLRLRDTASGRLAMAAGVLVGLIGVAAYQAQTALSATPNDWRVMDRLATLAADQRPVQRRTIRLGPAGDVALAPPSAQGVVVSGRDVVAALASDAALADAALLPRGQLRTLTPPPEDSASGARLAALAPGEPSVARPNTVGSGVDYDREMAERLGVAFLEGRDRLSAPGGRRALECLTEAIFFEARSEPIEGQAAVAEVVLNRVDSEYWPDDVCGVVNQGSERVTGCQFSYTCDGIPERIDSTRAWERAERIATLYLQGAPRRLTGHATHYHADYVDPPWNRTMEQTAKIGVHIFYRRLLRFALKKDDE